MGKDYPKGEQYFKQRLYAAFIKNKDERDPEKIALLIQRGEYVCKELEALYMLRKYRTLKKRYYDTHPPRESITDLEKDAHREAHPVGE